MGHRTAIDTATMFIGYGIALPAAPFATMDEPNTEINARLAAAHHAAPALENDVAVEFLATPDGRQFLLIAGETHGVNPGQMRSVPTYAAGPVNHWMTRLHAAAELLGTTPLTSPSWIAVHVA